MIGRSSDVQERDSKEDGTGRGETRRDVELGTRARKRRRLPVVVVAVVGVQGCGAEGGRGISKCSWI